MIGFISCLNKYSELLLTIITAINVILVYITLKTNKDVIKIMKEQHEAERRPYIQIRTYNRLGFIVCLLIKNVGKSSAKNVKFELDKDIFKFGYPQRNIKEFPLFKEGIKFFPPETEYHIDLGQHWLFFKKGINKEQLPLLFKITCTYSFFNKTVIEETLIDIKSTFKTTILTNETIDELRELKKEIAKISKEIRKLKK